MIADFLNGWDTQVLTDAIAQCINDVESGNISECPPLYASQDEYFATNCPEQPPLVNEQVKGVLSKLPGCNEVTSGPKKAPQGICPSQPSLNPVTNTDGQSRSAPVAGSTLLKLASGSTAQYKGCYSEASGSRALTGAAQASETGMSSSSCGAFCQSKGFLLFGTEYSKECYCGNAISTSTTPQSDCAMVCSGNRTEYCGGPSRLSVWSISKSATSSLTTSRASSSSAATPTVSGASYLGCYSDNTGGRTLTSSSTADKSMTLELCAQTAQNLNLKYFGLEYAGECFAGYTMASSAAPISESKCNMKCKGNDHQLCGGPDALSMFQNNLYVQPTNPALVNIGQKTQYAYQGCYTEGSSGRSLGGSGSYSTTSKNMTVEFCAKTCHSKGFIYAGVEYSQECYCNNAGVGHGGVPAPGGDADCSMLCAGNKAEFCGGSSRLSVYQLQSGPTFRRRHLHSKLKLPL